jgi:REP element-mobilizing transposase RayT
MGLKFFNPWAGGTVGASRLPHWDQPGATYFLTIRLADSLPAGLVAQWADERAVWLEWNPEPWSEVQEKEYHQRFSGTIERWLDDCHGECRLRSPYLRAAVAGVFTKFNRDRYWHHAWVLMPNHAHLLFSLQEGVVLSRLIKSWKGASSRAAALVNKSTKSSEAFWQKDYFDRLVRDRTHFWNCARYVKRNPAKLPSSDYTLWLSDEVREVLES